MDKKTCLISYQELEIFVKVWTDEAVQQQLAGTTKKARVSIDLAGILSASGFDRTPGQCRDKVKKCQEQLRCQNILDNKSNISVVVSHRGPFCSYVRPRIRAP